MYTNMYTTVFTVVTLLIGLSWADRPTTCPPGYQTLNHKCYAVISLSVTWPEAQSLCDAFGGDVLAILSDTEGTTVSGLFNQAHTSDFYWLDASDLMVPGSWKYHGRSADPVTYTKWAAGEPAGQPGMRCAAVQPGTSSWVAKQCTDKAMAICTMKLANYDMVG